MPFRFKIYLAALLSVQLIHPGIMGKFTRDFAASAAVPFTAPGSDRITVSVTGKGPDIILIPGLAGSAHVWDAAVSHLAPTHRVHVVQVAGFGGTPAGGNASGPVLEPTVAAIHAYIAANHLQGAAVIGHSLGGLMAMKLAIDHPGDASRIMIVDSLPFIGMMFGPQANVAMVAPQAAALRDQIIAGTQQAYAAAEPQQMARLIKSHNAEADAAIAAASASDYKVVAAALYDDMTTDVRPDLPKITVPVTILYPWDPTSGMPQQMFDTLYTGAFAPLPRGKAERIEGSYHFIMIDQPAIFLQKVDTFLGG
ncbi:alpha/beta fold hydrolase [Sphingomonas crusticola]|uniref:alpha/beta fold hydrolase n=1 Tax=Sphingomonas crusticola TaxID=1697973 RepID=UPI001967561F|nr:alpha/beta hydrolase [Sphingomonas crusticola]